MHYIEKQGVIYGFRATLFLSWEPHMTGSGLAQLSARTGSVWLIGLWSQKDLG